MKKTKKMVAILTIVLFIAMVFAQAGVVTGILIPDSLCGTMKVIEKTREGETVKIKITAYESGSPKMSITRKYYRINDATYMDLLENYNGKKVVIRSSLDTKKGHFNFISCTLYIASGDSQTSKCLSVL